MTVRAGGVSTEDHIIPVPGAPDVLVRLYRPPGQQPGERPIPVLITFFGGAFVMGSIDDQQNEYLAERRCLAGDVLVAAVQYTTAPEVRCPGPVLQGLAVLEHLRNQAAALGVDTSLMMLGGQSAGANIATAVALEDARRRHLPASEPHLTGDRDTTGATVPDPVRLILEAPVLDLSAGSIDPSAPNDMGLSASEYLAYRTQVRDRYLGPGADPRDPLASPLWHPAIELAPPVLLLAAQDDPLRGDAEAFHDRLLSASVHVVMAVMRGLTHDGFRDVTGSPAARLWHDIVDRELQEAGGASDQR